MSDYSEEIVVKEGESIEEKKLLLNDYEADKNYYKGLNYTENDSKISTGKYTEKNLKKVTINYYGYNYNLKKPIEYNIKLKTKAEITNVGNVDYEWDYDNWQNIYTRIDTITCTVSGIKKIKEDHPEFFADKGWTMSIQAPNNYFLNYFSVDKTNSQNNNIDVNISNGMIMVNGSDTSKLKEDNDTWIFNFKVAFKSDTETNLNNITYNQLTVNSFNTTIREGDDIPYGTISDVENYSVVSYQKCLPVDVDNNIKLDLIDNPFMNRPNGKGFNGWITNDNRYSGKIITNSSTFEQKLVTNIGNITNESGEYVVNLYPDWVEANIIFVSSYGDENNNGKTADTPINNDWNVINSKLNEGRKTCTKASNREANIVVLVNGTLEWSEMAIPNTAYTLTSLYDGINYGSNSTYLNVRNNGNVVWDSDFQLEYIYVNSGLLYSSPRSSSTDGTGSVTPCMYGNMYNLRIGRGIIDTDSNNCTFAQIQGGYYNHKSSEYKIVVESGKYYTIQLYRAGGGNNSQTSTTSNGILTIGNDVDRINNNNESLKIYNRMASKTSTSTNTPYTANDKAAIAIKIIVKSGTIGVDYFNNASTSDSSERNYAGIYVGGYGQNGYDKSDRCLLVEGGNIANIIGGLNISENDIYKTYMYIKDGNILNITGGAGYTHTYGNRIIQVTGGCVKYSISGGSNGVAANSDSNNGQLTGKTLIYIGGDTHIGAKYTIGQDGTKQIIETNTGEVLYGVNAGCVCGGANGNSSYAGQTDGSYIIIDGNAVVHNNIYGGGNYGIMGDPDNIGGSGKITFKNESSQFTTNKEYLITTSPGGGNGLNANGTDLANEVMSTSKVPGDNLKWIFESAGNGKYYIKNVATGGYLYVYNVSTSFWNTSASINCSQSNKTQFTVSGSNNKTIYYEHAGKWSTYKFYLNYGSGKWNLIIRNNISLYLLTYEENEKEDEIKDAQTIVNIKLLGGNIKNNIYGGANRNNINGTVDIEMNGGRISGTLYGGSNIEGNITGSVLMNIKGGQLGEESGISTNDYYDRDTLFGGGLGSSTKVLGRILLNINEQNNNLKIYGNVFGGSSLGAISNNITININDTESANKISIIGNVFGGGKGNSNTSAIVSGNIKINVDGSDLQNTSIFGGSDINGNIKGNIDIRIGENHKSTIYAVYGGGNKASINMDTKEVKVNILGNAEITNAFNGGKSADLLSAGEEDTTRGIYLIGGTVKNIYGGSDSSGIVSASNVYIQSGKAINVYGGNNQGGTTTTTNIKIQGGNIENTYGGGEKAETTTSNIEVIGGFINNLYGGGNQAGVSTTNVKIKKGNIGILFGGSNINGNVKQSYISTGDENESQLIIDTIYGGNNRGGVTETTNITINDGNIKNVYGGGNQAITNVTNVNINGNIENSVYGGGNQAGVNTDTNLSLTNAIVNNNVYGGGNEGEVKGNTFVYVKNTKLNNSLYAGGNGTTAIVYGNTNLYIHGTENDIKNSVFGGGNKAATGNADNENSTSTVNIVGATIGKNVYGGANTSVVYGTTKINIGYDAVKNQTLEKGKIQIQGTVFGGGEANDAGSEIYDFSFISVTKGIDIEIDGNGYDKFEIKGSIFGSGNASSAKGESNIMIKNYGKSDLPQSNISIQRANCVTIINSALSLSGATDRTNEYSNVFFSLSRIDKLKLKNNSTLYLCNGANLLYEVDSVVDENGKEEKAKVQINSETGEVIKNVDNRIYMLEGKNLNIATNEQVTAYGKVQGMIFLGLFTNRANPSTSTGFYHESYKNNDTITNAGTFSLNSYAMAQHMNDHDTSIDGFYTNYNKEGIIKTDYIETTPKDDVYYIWLVGEKMEVTIFEMSLTASKYATLGTYELLLQGFSEPNIKFSITGFSAGLAKDISLVNPSEINSIEPDKTKADTVFGLSMRTGNSGWQNNGRSTFLTDNGGKYEGTSDYYGDNSTYTPTLNFCLYHSQNISKKQALGDVRIRLQVLTPIDDLNYKMSYIDINITLSSALYQNDFYEAAITPGQEFGLFTSTETIITNKSAFSAYYSLYIDKFSKSDYYEQYTNYKRVLVSRNKNNIPYSFPENTKITMLDMVTNQFYYYIVSQEDVKNNKYVYNLSDFKEMGSNDGKYEEKITSDTYYDEDKDLIYENFIFHINFADSSIQNDIEQNTLLMELRNNEEQTLLGVLGIQRDTMKYSVYNGKSATIKLRGECEPKTLYLGNVLNLNIITEFTQSIVNSRTIYDTQYFDKKLGIKISIYDNNGNRLNSDSLFGINFEFEGKVYYPRIDGTTRISIADKATDVFAKLKVNTKNNKTLATGEYKIKIESFGSADGVYYGLIASDEIELDVRIINSAYGLKVTTNDKFKIIDKQTGFTLNENSHFVSKIEYSSGLANPKIVVALYRRDYTDIYSKKYNLVDLAEYIKETLVVTAKEKEYLITETPTQEIKHEFDLNENLMSGTYKLVYKLYDNNTFVGEAYEYIIIK